MGTFKDVIASDIKSTFVETTEFGDAYYINGVENVPGLLDSNELLDRQPKGAKHTEEFNTKELLLYVAAPDYGNLPRVGAVIIFGKTKDTAGEYVVTDSNDEDGIYAITMEESFI